jgi:NADH:ubiquinone oxidoreductase subunit
MAGPFLSNGEAEAEKAGLSEYARADMKTGEGVVSPLGNYSGSRCYVNGTGGNRRLLALSHTELGNNKTPYDNEPHYRDQYVRITPEGEGKTFVEYHDNNQSSGPPKPAQWVHFHTDHPPSPQEQEAKRNVDKLIENACPGLKWKDLNTRFAN